MGRLLEHLEASGELERTFLVLTSDHGESLGDHDFRGHGRLLYEGLVHVPLFVKDVEPPTSASDTRRTTAMDVHAMLGRAAGLAPLAAEQASPAIISEWRFLRNESDRRRADFEKVLGRRLDQDLVVWFEPDGLKVIAADDGTLEVYDLEQDPGEEHPLVLDAERAAALAERARAWWAGRPYRDQSVEPASEAEQRALKDLGYM